VSDAAPLTVTVERSGLIESTHHVDVAVVAESGALIARAGAVETVAYLRSTAKPIQAGVCLENGWEPSTEEAIAVACASHSGEREHVNVVRGILETAGLREETLRCPAAFPREPATAPSPQPIFHNCSGKHAAMLATCVANGWPLDDYPAEGHPLQRAVGDRLAVLAGRRARAVGIDGCGVPTFAYRLDEAAHAFAALPSEAPRCFDAMRAHPFLVAGTRRLCTAVLDSVPGVVIKVGAEGMFCGALLRESVGFALKARDGAVRAAEAAALATLRLLDVAVPDGLQPVPVLGGGVPVGAITVRGEFSRA
jgi:L-asparaginase II